jgi:hypothetical protein
MQFSSLTLRVYYSSRALLFSFRMSFQPEDVNPNSEQQIWLYSIYLLNSTAYIKMMMGLRGKRRLVKNTLTVDVSICYPIISWNTILD